MQLSLTCTDGIDATECVPACSEELHGVSPLVLRLAALHCVHPRQLETTEPAVFGTEQDLLLANIDGEDSKYSCELHHGRYSWMGAASDGG